LQEAKCREKAKARKMRANKEIKGGHIFQFIVAQMIKI
jgi:hypothetical protein